MNRPTWREMLVEAQKTRPELTSAEFDAELEEKETQTKYGLEKGEPYIVCDGIYGCFSRNKVTHHSCYECGEPIQHPAPVKYAPVAGLSKEEKNGRRK